MAYIIITGADGTRTQAEFPASGEAILGRSPDNCNVPVTGDGVSGVHCAITKVGDSYMLKDLDSTNGTFVNGDEIVEQPVYAGDDINLGGAVTITLAGDDVPVNPNAAMPSSPHVPESAPAPSPAPATISYDETPTGMQIRPRAANMPTSGLPTDFAKKSDHGKLWGVLIALCALVILALVAVFISSMK